MENFHLLGSNLHVIWLCLSWMLKSKSFALSIDIFVHIKSLCWKFFRPTPPLSAMVSFWLTPPPPSGGWRNMWTAPNINHKMNKGAVFESEYNVYTENIQSPSKWGGGISLRTESVKRFLIPFPYLNIWVSTSPPTSNVGILYCMYSILLWFQSKF